MSDPETSAPFGTPLTARELAVLRAVADADGYQAAADVLGISKHTVRNTLANARSRLGCRTTAGAYRVALSRGLLEPPQKQAA